MNQKIDNPAKKNTLPRITLNSLAEKRVLPTDSLRTESKSTRNFPIVPPKSESVINSLPQINDETPTWFVVLSPRETRGPTGPFSVNQLKQLYKREEIADRTLVWRDGEKEWKPLVQLTYLKAQITFLPPIPPRVSNYNAELKLFQPFSKMTAFTELEQVSHFIPLPEKDKNFRTCCQCGALGSYHTEEKPNQVVDVFKGQQGEEVGSNEFATEIIPGFLWIGNINAARPVSIQSLGITLLVNVSGYNGLIKSNPPYFRCKDINTLRESYDSDEVNAKQRLEILEAFERIYDWIEFERMMSEKNRLADPKPETPRVRQLNDYGFPTRAADDKPFRRPDADATNPFFPPRVLIWSKEGTNRACVVAMSYLIKQHGMSLPFAKRFIQTLKPQMDVDTAYYQLLSIWSKQYSIGFVFCVDCVNMLEKKKNVNLQVQEITNEGVIEMKPNPNRPVDLENDRMSKTIEETIEELSNTLQEIQRNTNIHQQHKIQLLSEGSLVSSNTTSIQPLQLPSQQALNTSSQHSRHSKEKDKEEVRGSISVASVSSATTVKPTPSLTQPSTTTNTAAAAAANTSVQLVHDIDKILPLTSFIKPLYTNVFFDTVTSYGGLCDVCFDSQQLSDNTLSVILQLMQNLTLLPQIRHLLLSDNQVKSSALKTLLVAFYPRENFDPDSDRYLDDDPLISDSDSDADHLDSDTDDDEDDVSHKSLTKQQKNKEKEEKQRKKEELRQQKRQKKLLTRMTSLKYIPNITILDLSHNHLDEQGVRYLTFFLQQCQSIITLNLFNNQLSDVFLAEILAAFITPTSQFSSDLASTSASFTSSRKKGGSRGSVSGNEKRIIMNNYFETSFFNQSVTDLNIGRNTLAAASSEVLERVIKQNVVLTSLNLEGCFKLAPKTFKRITEAIRLYNPHITRLCCDALPLSVKSCEYLGKIQGKSKVTRVRVLSMSRCNLTSLHVKHLSKFLALSTSVERLDLSANPLTDEAVPSIVDILLGQVGVKEATQAPPPPSKEEKAEVEEEVDVEEEEEEGEGSVKGGAEGGSGGVEKSSVVSDFSVNTESLFSFLSSSYVSHPTPPLTQLDLSSCSLSAKGCTDIITAIAQLPRALYEINLSFNSFKGSDVTDFFLAISTVSVTRINLASCHLQSKGGMLLFKVLTPSCQSLRVPLPQPIEGAGETNTEKKKKVMVEKPISPKLRDSLKYLNITENHVSDSVGPSLAKCITENLVIEEIDLSFNQLTEKHYELYQEAIKVTSSSSALRKLESLTITLTGNPCNPLMFDAPGMSRGKMRFTEGTSPNRFNSIGNGYDHIDAAAREAFYIRKELQYMTKHQEVVYSED